MTLSVGWVCDMMGILLLLLVHAFKFHAKILSKDYYRIVYWRSENMGQKQKLFSLTSNEVHPFSTMNIAFLLEKFTEYCLAYILEGSAFKNCNRHLIDEENSK